MKKLFLYLSFTFCLVTISMAQERPVDYEIKAGLEIIGAKESPRVIFFLPPLEVKGEKRQIKIKYFLDKSVIEEDIKALILEEVKDVSNLR